MDGWMDGTLWRFVGLCFPTTPPKHMNLSSVNSLCIEIKFNISATPAGSFERKNSLPLYRVMKRVQETICTRMLLCFRYTQGWWKQIPEGQLDTHNSTVHPNLCKSATLYTVKKLFISSLFFSCKFAFFLFL